MGSETTPSTGEIGLIETGIANTASITAALRRAGGDVHTVTTPADVRGLTRIVLPGVGSFDAGMATLNEQGFIKPLKQRLAAGEPTLCICLGLQLLAAESEESPETAGLGIVDERVEAFPAGTMTPHFGWNRVTPNEDTSLIDSGYAYFANSYRLRDIPPGWTGATAEHGGRFVAAMSQGDILATQFHPELSGRYGAKLIERWLHETQQDSTGETST